MGIARFTCSEWISEATPRATRGMTMAKNDTTTGSPVLLNATTGVDRPYFMGTAKAERLVVDVSFASDETLVADDRSVQSPAQTVETKLTRMLKEATLPVSHLQMRGLLRSR
jgi:hypothetical protein